MVETIVAEIKDTHFDFKGKKGSKKAVKASFTKKRKKILFHSLPIYVKFTEKTYDKIYEKRYSF